MSLMLVASPPSVRLLVVAGAAVVAAMTLDATEAAMDAAEADAARDAREHVVAMRLAVSGQAATTQCSRRRLTIGVEEEAGVLAGVLLVALLVLFAAGVVGDGG